MVNILLVDRKKKKTMDRKIKIIGINNDEPFEVPKRKPKHRIMLYEKMAELEKKNPDLFKNHQYRIQMESAYLALFMIQEKFPSATIEQILSMPDELEDPDNIVKLSCIAYGSDYDATKKAILGETKDFQKTGQKQ